MVRDTVGHLVGQGRRVFLDCEHFFDGWRLDRDYALVGRPHRPRGRGRGRRALRHERRHAAAPGRGGRRRRHRLDRRPGRRALPQRHRLRGRQLRRRRAGRGHPRAGHRQRLRRAHRQRRPASPSRPTSSSSWASRPWSPTPSRRAMHIAHAISEVTNVPAYSRQPYVGASAFAHKAGLHASALKVDPDLYQHMDPALVGNGMRTLVSDMAGRASIELKAREAGLDLSDRPDVVASVLAEVKDLELRGWTFDAADATVELMLREALEPGCTDYFEVESWRVITDSSGEGDADVGGDGQAARRRRAPHRHRRGQRSGQRPRPRPARGPDPGLPRDREDRAHRLQGAHPRRVARHRRRDARAHRDLGRRDVVGHHRRRRLDPRRVVAGPHRRHRPRPAPSGRPEALSESRQPRGRVAPGTSGPGRAGAPRGIAPSSPSGSASNSSRFVRLDDVRLVRPRADDDAELSDSSVRQCFSRQHRVVEGAERTPGHDDHAAVGKGSREVGQRLAGVGELDEQPSRALRRRRGRGIRPGPRRGPRGPPGWAARRPRDALPVSAPWAPAGARPRPSRTPVSRSTSAMSPGSPGATPVCVGLYAVTRSPAARAVATTAAVTTVLPTSVSVPVTTTTGGSCDSVIVAVG